MRTVRGRRRATRLLVLAAGGCLLGSNCNLSLRDGAVDGASLFVTQLTYTLLSAVSPIPLEPIGGGSNNGGGGDPFDNPPIQE